MPWSRRPAPRSALEAQSLLGSCYGARVAVLVGPGLNGDDGRVAAAWLRSRGAKVDVIDVAAQPDGTARLRPRHRRGLRTRLLAPVPRAARRRRARWCSRVDLPSGVDADSGALLGSPMTADVTMALGALKPAHVTGAAAALCGQLRFAGLGIVDRLRRRTHRGRRPRRPGPARRRATTSGHTRSRCSPARP